MILLAYKFIQMFFFIVSKRAYFKYVDALILVYTLKKSKHLNNYENLKYTYFK